MSKKIYIALICNFILITLFVNQIIADECNCINKKNNDCCSLIIMPSEYATMIVYSGIESYFVTKLSNIPQGCDFANGEYPGWCIQKDVKMIKGVLHTVKFYCSYDNNLTKIWQDEDWDKVNYIINHKMGEMMDVQEAIWYFIGELPTERPLAKLMIDDANDNGEGFCPKPGEKILILVDSGEKLDPIIQRSVIEVPVPLKYYLNIETEGGGSVIKNPNHICYSFEESVELTAIPDSGWYFNYWSGDLNGYNNPEIINLTGNINVTAHFKKFPKNGGTYTPNIEKNPVITKQNNPPVAIIKTSGSNIWFVNETITFNASLSWDSDNNIISWIWNFGDGNIGYGEIINHSYPLIGEYDLVLSVKDVEGAKDITNITVVIQNPNQPPSKPVIIGPTEGLIDKEYTFNFITTDIDNDKIKYIVNPGDGSIFESEFLPYGHNYTITHKWMHPGIYTIKVTADDNKTVNNTIFKIKIDAPKLPIIPESKNIILLYILLFGVLLFSIYIVITKKYKKMKKKN